MKNTNLNPIQMQRKFNALIQKKKDILRLESSMKKKLSEIQSLEDKLSQYFTPQHDPQKVKEHKI